jgi:hypothetical protein
MRVGALEANGRPPEKQQERLNCVSLQGEKGRGVAAAGRSTEVGEDAILLTLSGPALHCVYLLRKELGNLIFFFFFFFTHATFSYHPFCYCPKNDYCLLSLDFGLPSSLFFLFFILGTEFVFGGLLFQTVCPAPILFYGLTNAHRLCIVATKAAIGSYNFKERKK